MQEKDKMRKKEKFNFDENEIVTITLLSILFLMLLFLTFKQTSEYIKCSNLKNVLNKVGGKIAENNRCDCYWIINECYTYVNKTRGEIFFPREK